MVSSSAFPSSAVSPSASVAGLSSSDAALGIAFVGVVTWTLDLLVGFPLEHFLALLMFGSVLHSARVRCLFNARETLIFAGVAASIFLSIFLAFSAAFVTFTADAILLGHALLHVGPPPLAQQHQHHHQQKKQKRGMVLVMGMALLLDLLLAATLRSFAGLLARLLLSCSAAIGGTFLACLLLAEGADVAEDWVKVEFTEQVEEKRLQGTKPIPSQFDDAALDADEKLLETASSSDSLVEATDMFVDSLDNGRNELQSSGNGALLGAVQSETAILTSVDSAAGGTSGLDTQKDRAYGGSRGFLDKFMQHRVEMDWLKAKGRLLNGGVFLKRTATGAGGTGTGRRRMIRLNQTSAMLEWWKDDMSKLVGQARVEDLQAVYVGRAQARLLQRVGGADACLADCGSVPILAPNLSTDSTCFVLAFSSRTIELEAPNKDVAKIWVADLRLLLKYRMAFT